MKNIITIMLGILLLISLVSAEVITIEPKDLEPIQMYGGESVIRNITIITDGNYLVYLSYEIINNTNSTAGICVDYESPIQINMEKVIPITISAFFPDSFTIHLDASTEKTEELFEQEFIQNETIEVNGLVLDIDSDGTGNITIKTFKENPATGFSIPSLNIFFHIEASDSIIEGMNETILKVSYTDAEVNALGLDENDLRLYFYNETLEDWKLINSWVDTTNNIVYGKTNHFSLWGVFGEEKGPTIIYRRGGGTRKVYIENKTIEYVDNKTTEYIDRIINVIDISDDKIIDTTDEPDKFPWYYPALIILVLVLGSWLIVRKYSGKEETPTEE